MQWTIPAYSDQLLHCTIAPQHAAYALNYPFTVSNLCTELSAHSKLIVPCTTYYQWTTCAFTPARTKWIYSDTISLGIYKLITSLSLCLVVSLDHNITYIISRVGPFHPAPIWRQYTKKEGHQLQPGKKCWGGFLNHCVQNEVHYTEASELQRAATYTSDERPIAEVRKKFVALCTVKKPSTWSHVLHPMFWYKM